MKNMYQDIPLLKQVSPNTPEMPRLIHEDRKKVRFNKRDLVTIVASHRDFTSSECRSVWYNKTEYREFALKEIREKMNEPLQQRKEKHQRSRRINRLRRGVLHSQSDRRLQMKIRRTNSDYPQWLADFCKDFSDECVTEARQRGMENDLELLNIKIRELIERRPLARKMQPLARKMQLSKMTKTSNCYNHNTSNARWSTSEPKTRKDVAPNAIKRSSGLRRELCKDLLI
jgi:hypothetical protein